MEVGTFRLVGCYACLCLIALSQCILTYDLRRSCLPNLFLKDICCERTIERELVSSGSFIPSSHVSLSSCLDVSRIKHLWTDSIVGWVITALLRLCVDVREAAIHVGVVAPVGVTIQVTWLPSLVGGFSGHSVWLQLVSRWAWLWCHTIGARGHTTTCSCRFGVIYKCHVVAQSSSLDTAPLTRSLLFAAPERRLTVSQAAVFRLCGLIECNDCFRIAVCQALQRLRVDFVMATGSDTPAGARSGVTFDVTLEVPGKPPDAYVQLHSEGVFELEKTVPDVLGLCGRRPDAAVVRVMQGRDARSVRVLIPDPRVLERGFHDVTIIDMEETAEPAVSEADLSLPRRQWLVWAVQSMTWLENDLDYMRSAAKKRY